MVSVSDGPSETHHVTVTATEQNASLSLLVCRPLDTMGGMRALEVFVGFMLALGALFAIIGGVRLAERPPVDSSHWWIATGTCFAIAFVLILVVAGNGFLSRRKESGLEQPGRAPTYLDPATPPPEAVLEFSAPEPQVVHLVDTQTGFDRGSVRLWRVTVTNRIEGTCAQQTTIRLAKSEPPIPVFPVDLHRYHNDERPYDKKHDIRYGEPVTVDVIGKDVKVDRFYLWRSDLPPHYGDYIYPLSDSEKKIVFDALLEDGMVITLRAVPDVPAKFVEQSYRVFRAGDGELAMEKDTGPWHPRLTVEDEQWFDFQGRLLILEVKVRIENGPKPFTITSYSFESSGYAQLPNQGDWPERISIEVQGRTDKLGSPIGVVNPNDNVSRLFVNAFGKPAINVGGTPGFTLRIHDSDGDEHILARPARPRRTNEIG